MMVAPAPSHRGPQGSFWREGNPDNNSRHITTGAEFGLAPGST